MKLIMTGHDGLIGSYLKKKLEEQGHEFVMLIDQRSGRKLDLLKDWELKGADLFIHSAAFCKINQAIETPELAYESNVEGVFNALEFCRRNDIKKFLFFSSSRVLSPEKNPYTASKIYGEELCKAYQQCYGIDYIIIRPSTVYGPFQDLTRRLVHIYITNALEGKDLIIYGDPNTKTLDFTHVDDFVQGVLLALNAGWNKEYDISGESEYNIHRLAEYIIEKTGSKSKIIVYDAEKAQPQMVRLDISAIKALGYKPKYSVEEGILHTIEWYKQNTQTT